ncbi:isopropylmalate isomerase [Roseovarius sp. S1116L3]|uniref:isopropylmalate isomerase n=1 Tax=Roseovarius roseus TaxID=3342636 RepID=UPI00372683B5
MNPHDLADCVFARWSPQIGDPSIIGWITVASYFIVSVFSVMVSYRQFGRHRMFWLFLTVLLFALGVNKQLDLQSALTAVGRCLAQAQGWYAERRTFQLRFIISIIISSFLFGPLLVWLMRRHLRRVWLALIGILLLLVFVAVRAIGFHHFDQFIGYEIGSIRINWVFEIGGTTMIGFNALYLLFFTSRDEKIVEGCER